MALYIRVSTDEQAKTGYSIADQRRELTRHAEASGYEVVETITDDGFSGASRDRPGLARIYELAEAGRIDLVLAAKRDRFFRSRLYRLMVDEDLEEMGVRLVALNDTNNRIGDGVQDDFAEWEREIITERMLRGRMQRARSGKVLPGISPPHGYRYDADRTGYEVVPEMENVRRVFEMVAGGASLRSVKRTFEREGVPSPFGKPTWSAYMVRRIILQDAYRPHSRLELEGLVEEGLLTPEVLESLDPKREYGVAWYGKAEVRRTRHGRKSRERPRDQWIAVPVPPSSVPAEVVERARAATQDNVRPSRADDILWALTGGILHCPCGRRMLPKRVGGGNKLYHYYSCGSYWRPSGEHCKFAKSHPAHAVEERVAGFVLALIRDPEVLRHRVEEQALEERRRLGGAARDAERLRGKLVSTAQRRSNLIDLAADGTISREDLRAKLEELDSERAAVERELGRIGDRDRRLRELEALPALVGAYLRDLPYLVDRRQAVRDYETILTPRTQENPLGLHRLTPEGFRHLTDEELAAERLRADNERRARLREIYEAIGLRCTLRPDGTIEAAWRLEEGVVSLPGVNTVERSL